MKKLGTAFFIFLLLSAASPPARAEGVDPPFAFNNTDYQVHMLASYGVAFTFTDLFRSKGMPKGYALLLGDLTAVAIAASKERFLDDHWSSNDMLANYIGIVTSSLVSYTIHF